MPVTLSVIVPTYGRPQQLALCLDGLASQDYPRRSFEVIAVDDGSEFPARELVNSFADRLPLTLLCEPHRGPASARNAGAAIARGEILVFTDDDCIPDPGWLSSLAKRFENDSECVVGGRTVNDLSNNPYSSASQLLIDYLYKHYNAIPGKASLLTSNNLAIPASLFRDAGGFDGGFTRAAAEDRELCDRLRHRCVRLTYAPEVIVLHRHSLSFMRFWRQHFNYGTGAFRYHQLRSSRNDQNIKLEPPAYYWKLLRFPAKSENPRVLSLTALIALSQVANAAGFFHQKLTHSLRGRNGHAPH